MIYSFLMSNHTHMQQFLSGVARPFFLFFLTSRIGLVTFSETNTGPSTLDYIRKRNRACLEKR